MTPLSLDTFNQPGRWCLAPNSNIEPNCEGVHRALNHHNTWGLLGEPALCADCDAIGQHGAAIRKAQADGTALPTPPGQLLDEGFDFHDARPGEDRYMCLDRLRREVDAANALAPRPTTISEHESEPDLPQENAEGPEGMEVGGGDRTSYRRLLGEPTS